MHLAFESSSGYPGEGLPVVVRVSRLGERGHREDEDEVEDDM